MSECTDGTNPCHTHATCTNTIHRRIQEAGDLGPSGDGAPIGSSHFNVKKDGRHWCFLKIRVCGPHPWENSWSATAIRAAGNEVLAKLGLGLSVLCLILSNNLHVLVDEDECTDGTNTCHTHATCTNTELLGLGLGLHSGLAL